MILILKAFRFVNLVLAALLVGNEFGSWVAVHPALGNLPAHIRAEQAIVRRYGKIMPFLMVSTTVSGIIAVRTSRGPRILAPFEEGVSVMKKPIHVMNNDERATLVFAAG